MLIIKYTTEFEGLSLVLKINIDFELTVYLNRKMLTADELEAEYQVYIE